MLRCITILCWLLLLLPLGSMAERWQSWADTMFQHLGKEQGLPQLFVRAIGQDRAGFLWFATEDGLARWDGYRMRKYQNDSKNPRSLPNNYLTSMHIDRQGRLWVGTFGSGLARYNPMSDDFDLITAGDKGLSNPIVNVIMDDGRNGVWIGTDNGLDHWQSDKLITHFRHAPQSAVSLPSNRIRALMLDNAGQIWIGTEQGLVRFDGHGFVLQEFFGLDRPPGIESLMQSADGSVWIGTASDGTFVIEAKALNPAAKPVFDAALHGRALVRESVNAMVEFAPGKIWFGSAANGIVEFDQASKRIRIIHNEPGFPGSLANNKVLSMLRDQSGFIWVGTQRGVSRCDSNQSALLTLLGGEKRSQGLADIDVRSVFVESENRIWLGLEHLGLDIVDPERGRIASLRPNVEHPESALQEHSVVAIEKGPDGMVYMATGDGLYRADVQASKVQRVENPFRKPTSRVMSLYRQGGYLWVGGQFDGLWVIDKSGQLLRPQGVGWSNLLQVSSMAAESDEVLWVGTWQGLHWFHPASGQVRQIQADMHDLHALGNGPIHSLLIDASHRLWVGTGGSGLYVMMSQSNDGKPQFVRVKGLRNANINKLVMDKSGMVWVSSDDGLVRVDPATLQVLTLQNPDGLTISAYWPGSGAVTQSGEVLFGGLGGLTVVRPAWYKKWDYKPPVVLTELSVGARVQNAQRLNLLSQPASIKLQPQENQLNVEFAALDYSAPELNRYQYWLEGYDEHWNSSDANRRLATYANLPPGQYQLHLRAAGRSGVWGAPRVLPIEVLPAWYQTWWSKTGVILASLSLVLLIMTGLVQRRTHLLRQRQQQLQLEVNQRTGQLQAIQAELLAANQDMNQVNDDLALWVDTLRHLGEVGQEITAKLKISSVTEVLQRHVESLMNVAAMVLLRIEPEGATMSLLLARVDGQSVHDFGPYRLDDGSFVAQVARGKQELLIQKAAISGRSTASQSLFVPLVIDQRLLGVMAIESQPGEQYGERECLIFRTLCAYGAIALDNAEAYRQVGVTLKTLGDTQAQLVQQAKIASLGTLTAGVAHEINNPANFAYVGSYNLRQQLASFHRYLLDLSGPDAPHDLLTALQARFDELGESLNVITEGATRIRDLVKDLRTFSRLDEADWKEVAIADSLSATVNLVRTQYAHQVEIIAELDANPTLMCWPAQLNQVFMNLIVNACQAIAKRPEPEDGSVLPHGRLVIRSRLDAQDWLVLEFEDNGTGMSAELIEQIFDPFFTTKGVGEGMGMGLSITLGIIDKHRGHIDVKSSPGQGSCFILRLPLSQQAIVKDEVSTLPLVRAA